MHRVNEAVRLYQSNVRLTKLQEHIVISMIKDDVDFCLVGKTRRNVQRQLLLEMQVHKGKPKKKATFLLLVLTDMIVLLEETHHPHPTGADRDAKFYNFCGQPLGIESVNVCIIEEPIVNGFSAMMRQSGKFYWFEISFGTAKLVLSVDSETDRSRILNSIRSGAKAASAVVEKFQPILTLNCMGTLFIDLHGATKLPDPGKDSLCFGFELNDQRLQCRACSKINSAFVMPMLSFDDRLRITLSRQHPYKPNHTLAATDLSLDFLEYYGEKGTQGYHVSIGPECVILVDFQFRPV